MTPDTPETPPAPGESRANAAVKRRSLLSELGSLIAIAISFGALALGAYQTNLMQRQARASVWPYLHIAFSYIGNPDLEETGFAWQVDNNGVGPALIKTVDLTLDEKPMRNWQEVYKALQIEGTDQATIATIHGNVLPPNTNRETTITGIRIKQPRQSKALFDARSRFKMAICYCSVYDDCWIAHWLESDVQSVPQCPAKSAAAFEQ